MSTAFTPEIDAFLFSHHVISLATCVETRPWVASLFYAFDQPSRRLYYFTDPKTRHGANSLINPCVGVTIAPPERDITKIAGLQMTAQTYLLDGQEAAEARSTFALSFPEIAKQDAPIWSLIPDYIKMVDNAKGFGNKQEWFLTEA